MSRLVVRAEHETLLPGGGSAHAFALSLTRDQARHLRDQLVRALDCAQSGAGVAPKSSAVSDSAAEVDPHTRAGWDAEGQLDVGDGRAWLDQQTGRPPG